VSEWVEFNTPLNTIQVISEAVCNIDYKMSATDFVSNLLYPETEIKTETEIKMIWKLKLKRKCFPKQKYNRNLKDLITHKTVIETELIFETEISLS